MVFDGSIETYGVDKSLIVQDDKYGNEWIVFVRGTWEYIQYLLWWIAKQNIPKIKIQTFIKWMKR